MCVYVYVCEREGREKRERVRQRERDNGQKGINIHIDGHQCGHNIDADIPPCGRQEAEGRRRCNGPIVVAGTSATPFARLAHTAEQWHQHPFSCHRQMVAIGGSLRHRTGSQRLNKTHNNVILQHCRVGPGRNLIRNKVGLKWDYTSTYAGL